MILIEPTISQEAITCLCQRNFMNHHGFNTLIFSFLLVYVQSRTLSENHAYSLFVILSALHDARTHFTPYNSTVTVLLISHLTDLKTERQTN